MYNSSMNSYKQAIDTLTAIDKNVIDQKFYSVNIPDFVDIDVGNGAFKDQIFNYQTFDVAGDGFEGFQTDVSNESRMPSVDISYNGRIDQRRMWNKKVSYKLSDIKQIQAILREPVEQRNFDVIEKKLEARKRNFDLMLQDVAFLGNPVFNDIDGLLNNSEVTVDATLLTAGLGSLTDAQFQLVVGNILARYVSQNNYAELAPNRLVIPYSDFLSLTQINSIQFPMKSKLEVLEDAFKRATANPDFKILASPYAEAGRNGTENNIYVLYRKDPDVLVLDLPVEYTTTAFGTIDNYVFYNVGYGQVGGVRIFRPQEVLYLTAPANN